MMYMLDLNGIQPVLGVLEQALRELAVDIRAGRFGESAVVVSTQDPALQRYVELLAEAEDLPIYISGWTTAFSLVQARPAANLTRTEKETLDAVMDLGGSATAGEVAKAVRIRQSAALNRLNGLASRRLLHRQPQAGRRADLYVDYRSAALDYAQSAVQTAIKETAAPR